MQAKFEAGSDCARLMKNNIDIALGLFFKGQSNRIKKIQGPSLTLLFTDCIDLLRRFQHLSTAFATCMKNLINGIINALLNLQQLSQQN